MWKLLLEREGEAQTIWCGPKTGSDANAGKRSHWGVSTTKACAAPVDREWRHPSAHQGLRDKPVGNQP